MVMVDFNELNLIVIPQRYSDRGYSCTRLTVVDSYWIVL
jgi:hypothetical protein